MSARLIPDGGLNPREESNMCTASDGSAKIKRAEFSRCNFVRKHLLEAFVGGVFFNLNQKKILNIPLFNCFCSLCVW